MQCVQYEKGQILETLEQNAAGVAHSLMWEHERGKNQRQFRLCLSDREDSDVNSQGKFRKDLKGKEFRFYHVNSKMKGDN